MEIDARMDIVWDRYVLTNAPMETEDALHRIPIRSAEIMTVTTVWNGALHNTAATVNARMDTARIRSAVAQILLAGVIIASTAILMTAM